MGDMSSDKPQPEKGGKTISIPVRESRNAEPHNMLGNKALLSKIDKLRELNVGALVPLPQIRTHIIHVYLVAGYFLTLS
jgi:hypothetical protein